MNDFHLTIRKKVLKTHISTTIFKYFSQDNHFFGLYRRLCKTCRQNISTALRFVRWAVGLLIAGYRNRRMIKRKQFEFVGKCENVEAKYGGYNPFGNRAGHMIFPATVRRIPFSGILSIIQNVRNDAGHGHNNEAHHTQSGQSEPNVRQPHRSRVRLDAVRKVRLNPKVHGADAKANERAAKVYEAHVRLLEVGHNAAAQTRRDAQPKGTFV